MSNHNDITALREILFATLREVRAGSIDLDKARAINEVGKTLIDSAKVEVAYLQATGGGESPFLEAPKAPPAPGIVSVVRHSIGR